MIFFSTILFYGIGYGQNTAIEGKLFLSSSMASGGKLPFWLTHNQSGKYDDINNLYQLVELDISGEPDILDNTILEYGLDVVGAYTNNLSWHVSQLYIGLKWKWLAFNMGSYKDSLLFAGLSSSNGNIVRSLNSRPYPKIRISTNGYVPFLFFKKYLSFQAEYDEGLLNDKRVVENSRLHHKSVYIKYHTTSGFNIAMGLDHYVFWGGQSPTYGQLPDSFNDYFTYILGKSGDDNFPAGDINTAGNHLGAYLLKINIPFKEWLLKFYISHPFDDHSGMELDNYLDNLYGVNFNSKSNRLFQNILFEFLYTLNQSGSEHIISGPVNEHERGRDNYFNNGVYSSGFTHHGMVMGTPLISPVKFEGTLPNGIANNRVVGYHLGLSGRISNEIKWKLIMTRSSNYGTYSEPYNNVLKQFSSLYEIMYVGTNIPFQVSLSVGIDRGELYEDVTGVRLKISKKLF